MTDKSETAKAGEQELLTAVMSLALSPEEAAGAEQIKRAEEFIAALNKNATNGSIIEDLAKLLTECLGAEYPKFDKAGDLVAMIPDHMTRVKGGELLLKVLKLLSSEPAIQVNVPIQIKWQD